MKNVLATIKSLNSLGNATVWNAPVAPPVKAIQQSLEILEEEFSQTELDRNKIHQLHYGLVRAYQDSPEIENTKFGNELGELLVQLNDY